MPITIVVLFSFVLSFGGQGLGVEVYHYTTCLKSFTLKLKIPTC